MQVTEEKPTKSVKKKEKKLTQAEKWKQLSLKYYEGLPEEEKQEITFKIIEVMQSPIFTPLPKSWEDSKNFGWMRGLALLTETGYKGKWHSWLSVNAKGELTKNDYIPHYDMDESKSYNEKHPKQNNVGHMLSHCLEIVRQDGGDVRDLVEWIGYSLGIAWFKKPKFRSEKTWQHLYTDFVLDLFWLEPADYLSSFIAQHGQGGIMDYFPTPIHVTKAMTELLYANADRMEVLRTTVCEPCLGGAAMMLNQESLNLIGQEITPTMVRIASIQAFLYLPSLLYTPKPIVGLHADKETMTLNRYFEFDTNTRIYWGDSLLGEFQAPQDIFKESDDLVDVYFHPFDATKVEWYKLEEQFLEYTQNEEEMPYDFRVEVTKAQARLIGINAVMTNPPFNAKLNKQATMRMKEISVINEQFFKDRELRLEKFANEMPISKEIQTLIELKKADIDKKIIDGQLELVFS